MGRRNMHAQPDDSIRSLTALPYLTKRFPVSTFVSQLHCVVIILNFCSLEDLYDQTITILYCGQFTCAIDLSLLDISCIRVLFDHDLARNGAATVE